MKLVKEILTKDENEIKLSERSLEIDTQTQAEELREIVKALKDTMREKDIIALAAPQIGYQRRIFCIKFDTEIKTFINPIIARADDITLSREKSIVIPGKEYLRPRNVSVIGAYQRPTGKIETGREFQGIASLVYQQMMDALDGLLLSDIGLELDDDWDKATDEERMEVIESYLDVLDLSSKKLQEEIQADPELKQMKDAIDYMTSVYTGETELEGE